MKFTITTHPFGLNCAGQPTGQLPPHYSGGAMPRSARTARSTSTISSACSASFKQFGQSHGFAHSWGQILHPRWHPHSRRLSFITTPTPPATSEIECYIMPPRAEVSPVGTRGAQPQSSA